MEKTRGSLNIMKLINTLLLFFLILLTTSCTDTALLFINSLAKFGSYTSHLNVNYNKQTQTPLDIYLPDNVSDLNQQTLPTVVFFYGGCWGACSDLDKTDYQFIAQTLTSNNMIAVIVDYRKYPEVLFPDIIKDAALSVEWVSKNISSYQGNPQNIYLMGHSAGAHLASMLTYNKAYLTNKTYKSIKGFIGLAGAYDFLPFDEPYQPALFAPLTKPADSQTINFVEGNEPPALLLYGNTDKRVKRRNIISLTKMIKDKNGKVETHFYDDINHTGILSALSIPFRASKPILNDILKFIKITI